MSSIYPWMCTGGCSSNSAHSWLSQGTLWAEDTSAMSDHQVILLHCPLLLIIFSECLNLRPSFLLFATLYLTKWFNFLILNHYISLYITSFIFYFEVEMLLNVVLRVFFLLQIWDWNWASVCNHGPLWRKREEEGQCLMVILRAMNTKLKYVAYFCI